MIICSSRFAFFVVLLLYCGPLSAYDGKPKGDFPYELSRFTDLILLPVGAALSVTSLVMREAGSLPTEEDVLALDSSQVNGFDRPATENLSEFADTTSDVTFAVLHTAGIYLPFFQLQYGRWKNALILTSMYMEALLITNGITGITKALTGRMRPYMYNTELTVEQKLENGLSAKRSFFSGHTSLSFCSGMFVSKVFADLRPGSSLKFWVAGTAMTVAALTGYARYAAGMHFTSDVLTGALVGGSIGYLIPVLHKKRQRKLTILPLKDGDTSGVAVVGVF